MKILLELLLRDILTNRSLEIYIEEVVQLEFDRKARAIAL